MRIALRIVLLVALIGWAEARAQNRLEGGFYQGGAFAGDAEATPRPTSTPILQRATTTRTPKRIRRFPQGPQRRGERDREERIG